MTTQDIRNLKLALRDDPLDDITYLALADALDEVGRHVEAARYRAGKPSILDVIHHFVPYYHQYKDRLWGNLKPVMENHHTGDWAACLSLSWCRRDGDEEGVKLSRILMRLSKTQRGKLSEMHINKEGVLTLYAKAHVHVKGISDMAPAIDYGRQRREVKL